MKESKANNIHAVILQHPSMQNQEDELSWEAIIELLDAAILKQKRRKEKRQNELLILQQQAKQ